MCTLYTVQCTIRNLHSAHSKPMQIVLVPDINFSLKWYTVYHLVTIFFVPGFQLHARIVFLHDEILISYVLSERKCKTPLTSPRTRISDECRVPYEKKIYHRLFSH